MAKTGVAFSKLLSRGSGKIMFKAEGKALNTALAASSPTTTLITKATMLLNEPFPFGLVSDQLPNQIRWRYLVVYPPLVAVIVERSENRPAFEAPNLVYGTTRVTHVALPRPSPPTDIGYPRRAFGATTEGGFIVHAKKA
jgi:hypothetical protein